MSEREFQKEALEYLRNHPKIGDVWRNDSRRVMGRKFGSVGADRPRGLCDVVGYTVDGKILAIELKAAKGKPTEDQTRFVTRVKAFGGRAGVAKTLADIDEILDS